MSGLRELVIACGDPQGIGPEVAVAAARRFLAEAPDAALTLVGAQSQLAHLAGDAVPRDARTPPAPGLGCVSVADMALPHAAPSAEGGAVALQSLKVAFERAQRWGGALVTAPLSKQAVNARTPGFTGHTEWLGQQCGAEPLMLFAAPGLKIALATVHTPLSDVPARVRGGAATRALGLLQTGLVRQYRLAAPRVAVLALNPHAGEGGLLGREEIEVLEPLVRQAQAEGGSVTGPFSADGFFGAAAWRDYDAVLAMYHDQGLIAVKALGFGSAVNVTLGLPLVRTSPDHGCAFALAGTGRASSDGMLAALREAAQLLRIQNPV